MNCPICAGEYLSAALNTLNAPWWKLLLAQIFGKKHVGRDGDTTVVMHRLGGKYYLTDYIEGETA